MRPYVWDLITTANQSFVDLAQAVNDTYLERRHFIEIYASLQQIVFVQLHTLMRDVFDEDCDSCSMIDEASSGKHDIAFIKQFMIEFEFLKAVTQQELDRVKELSPEDGSG